MSNSKRTTKEQLIRSIGREAKVDLRSVRLVYNTLENRIRKLLEEVNKDQDAEIKIFDGITVEGKYIPTETRINNLTGLEIEMKAKIRPHAKISRRYCERLNNKL